MRLVEGYAKFVQHHGARWSELDSASPLYPCYPLASKELLTHVRTQRTTNVKLALCTVETGFRHELGGVINSPGFKEGRAIILISLKHKSNYSLLITISDLTKPAKNASNCRFNSSFTSS